MLLNYQPDARSCILLLISQMLPRTLVCKQRQQCNTTTAQYNSFLIHLFCREKYFPRCYKSFLLPPFSLSPWFWGRPHYVDKSSSDSQLSCLYLPCSRITGLYSRVSWDWDEREVLWISLGVSNTTHESAPPSVLGTEDVTRVRRDSLITLQMRVRVVALMLSARAPLTYGTNSMLCGNMEIQAAVSSILFGDLQIFEANINRFSLWKGRMYV